MTSNTASSNTASPDTKWSNADIPDQTGKVALITGANSGIGLETARELVRRGAHVILACRNLQRAEAAVNDLSITIEASGATGSVSIELVDIGVLDSAHALAERVQRDHHHLDLLINNAGIMAVARALTVDGVESQLATNHLGHFALTARLWPLILAADAPRVVSVSSLAHRPGAFDFDDMTLAASGAYTPMGAYRRSKLANLLFAYELQRRIDRSMPPEREGPRPLSVAAHPGLTETRLASDGERPLWFRLLRPAIGTIIQAPPMGALPTLRAATDPAATGGQYYGPAKLKEVAGPPIVVQSNARSHDPALAQRLWAWSEQATALTFL